MGRLAETTGSPGNPVWRDALHALQEHGASVQQSFAVLDCGTAYDFAQRSIRTMGHDGATAQPIAAQRAHDIVDICGDALREQNGGVSVTPTGGRRR